MVVRRWSKLVAVVAMMAVTSALAAQETGISRQDLIDGSWRLMGVMFATSPAGGPITFRSDSTVLTSNFRSVTMWSLTDGVLRLLGSSGGVYYRFDWLPRARVFRDCSNPSLPASLVIFQPEALSSSPWWVRCENGPQMPPRTFGVSCRLEVVPAQIRKDDAVEFRYVIASRDSQRVSGRYFRLDEETFGHSIRLRTDAGEEYRFLRASRFSYLAHAQLDTGEVTPRTYRFRFVGQAKVDRARVVRARDWNRALSAYDSASSAERERVFAAGATTIPPGAYVISADLPFHIFWTRDRGEVSPVTDPLSCIPARLFVLP